jgi:integrase
VDEHGRVFACRHEKLLRVPAIEMLAEAPPRQGFFEDHQYEAVRRQLPVDLQVAVAIMHTYGWRKREVLGLERRQLDLKIGTLRLEPGTTKNAEGRLVYLTPSLKTMLAAQVERVESLQKRLGRIVPALFPHGGRGTRAGTPRQGLSRRWLSACEAAGVPGHLLHDFRRTAVRNMERRGVARSVAMKITGHRTESVYRRYAIGSDADLQDAARKLAGISTGTTTGTTAATAVDTTHGSAR